MSSTPEAPLRFDCPACGAVLTVPAAIAGMQGPCPKCWQEIISPDPAIGAPARLPAPPQVATPAPEPEPVPVPAPPPEPQPVPEPIAAEIPEPPPAPAPAPPPPPSAGETTLSEDELADLATIPAPRRRSKALLVLGLGIPLLTLASVGYYLGKDRLPVILESPTLGQPAPRQSPAPASSTDAAPAPTPDETGQGLQVPPAPEVSEANDAQEALVAFLGAPDWQARSAFVLFPDEVRPAMEKHAKDHGDGPIPASSVHLNEDQSVSPVFVFHVCTKAMPDGFPVPVTLTDEGPKIDWESFTAFNDDHFRKLLTGPPDQTGIFSLLVKPETGAEPSPHWFRYRLAVPMPGREATGWVRKDSVTLARLRSVFDGSNGYDKETVDAFVSRSGVPLQLSVMKRRTSDGQEFIEIVDLVAVKWGPRER